MSEPPAARPRYAEGRDALLDAAARVIARDGFEGLSYRSVAREAGTTHGLVTYHFGSRDRLIHEVVARAGAEAVKRTLPATPDGGIDGFARDLVPLAEEAPEAQALQFELALEARRRPELQAEVRELYDHYIEAVQTTLTTLGIETDEALSRLVFAALDGLMLQHLVYGDSASTEAALDALRALLKGVAGHL